ncbi:MAG: hypothetical protein RQ760_10555 [Sedimentisphaerales bacterium]|nr:hypothetical protein [Sedimentisphaerales bacterium]
MSLIERQEVLSEDITETGETDNMKLVPVAESIRYRKRAQSAEKKVEDLTEELAHVKSEATKISERLSDIETERKLMSKLATAGSVDLETVLLLAKARMEGQEDADLDGVIEQLKKEKQYLFGGAGEVVTAKKTAGAKGSGYGGTNNQTVLEKAAKRAAATGSRTDLQEYLKLRRNFL